MRCCYFSTSSRNQWSVKYLPDALFFPLAGFSSRYTRTLPKDASRCSGVHRSLTSHLPNQVATIPTAGSECADDANATRIVFERSDCSETSSDESAFMTDSASCFLGVASAR